MKNSFYSAIGLLSLILASFPAASMTAAEKEGKEVISSGLHQQPATAEVALPKQEATLQRERNRRPKRR